MIKKKFFKNYIHIYYVVYCSYFTKDKVLSKPRGSNNHLYIIQSRDFSHPTYYLVTAMNIK